MLLPASCGRAASCFVQPGSPALPVFLAALELAVSMVGASLRRWLISKERRLTRPTEVQRVMGQDMSMKHAMQPLTFNEQVRGHV